MNRLTDTLPTGDLRGKLAGQETAIVQATSTIRARLALCI